MSKFDLIDIDEENLPNVNLSDAQKQYIKKRLESKLNRFLKQNSKLDIDASTDNIREIGKKLGQKKYSTVHMISHANFLRELVTDAIDKDCPLNPDEILYKKALRRGAGNEFNDIASNWPDHPFYYQIYISKDKFLIYTLNYELKLLDTRELKLTDIESTCISDQPYSGYFTTKFTNNNLIISTKENIFPYPKIYYLVDDNPKDLTSLKEIESLLLSLGIKKFIPKNSGKLALGVNIFFITILIMIIIGFIFYF